MTTGQIVTAIGGGASMAAFIGGLWTYITGRSVRSADATKTITAASADVVQFLRADLVEVRGKLTEVEDRLDALEAAHDDLRLRFRSAIGHIRDWMTWWQQNHPETTPPPVPEDLRKDLFTGT